MTLLALRQFGFATLSLGPRIVRQVARISGHADTCYRGTVSVWAAAMGGADAEHADACLANPVAAIIEPHVTRGLMLRLSVALFW